MKKNNTTENEEMNADFFETLIGLAKQAVDSPQQPNSLCIDRSRTINHINVEVHIENQPRPGLLRRLFSKLF